MLLESHNGRLLYTVDGDTHDFEVSSKVFGRRTERGRLLEADTPEINRLATREQGMISKQASKEWLVERHNRLSLEFWERDVFGRWLWYIRALGEEESLNGYMVRMGYAVSLPVYKHIALIRVAGALHRPEFFLGLESLPMQIPDLDIRDKAIRDRIIDMTSVELEAGRYGVDPSELAELLTHYDYVIAE